MLALVYATVCAPLPAAAQAGKVTRIGLLGVTSETGYARQIAALRQGFRDLGYVEGQNIFIDYRWADGRYDRLPVLAAELIAMQPDVIVTSGRNARLSRSSITSKPAPSDARAPHTSPSSAPGPRPSGKIVEMRLGIEEAAESQIHLTA